MDQQTRVAAFIDRWKDVSGSERANYQLFIADLCELLDVPHPEPAQDEKSLPARREGIWCATKQLEDATREALAGSF